MEAKIIAYMRLPKLSESEVQSQISNLEGWSIVNGKLHKEFELD